MKCRGPLSRSGIRQLLVQASFDVLTVTETSVPGCLWLLRGLERLVTWARMIFKPAKCRSLVLRKGGVEGKYCFHLDGLPIPSVSEKTARSLGKITDATLRDTAAIQSTHAELKTWQQWTGQAFLSKFNAWIYQHGILPRLDHC